MSGLYPAYKADEKFSDAQLRAFIQDILATLTWRKSARSLLSYEEIRSHLRHWRSALAAPNSSPLTRSWAA